jgi:hypothetical protein
MTAESELRDALEHIGKALDGLQIPWAIGGSFASTVHGEPRATNDIDIVANLRAPHTAAFVRALSGAFYVDEQSIRQAIAERDSFNVIDERSFLKVDIFIPAPGPLGEGQLDRRRAYRMSENGPQVFVLGPEDTALQKLRWFELGGRVSDRQWRDILGVIRLGGELDLEYMQRVAEAGELTASLDRALAEATSDV